MASRLLISAIIGCLLASACSTSSHEYLGDGQFAVVNIENDTARTVWVFDCPVCRPRGGIPGAPGGRGGGMVGWTVSEPGPLTYAVELRGQRIVCRLPKPVDMTANLPTAGPLYDVLYRVRPGGACELARW